MATRLDNAFVLNVSLKDFQQDESPLDTIGARMPFQLLQNDTGPIKTTNDIYSEWYAPNPRFLMELPKAGHSKEKTVVLIVDDLHTIA